jgi:hypothetical protein
MTLQDGDSDTDFIFKASLNGSLERESKRIKLKMIKRNINILFNEQKVTPTHIRLMLPSILDKRAYMALMTMPRLEEENRMKNENFVICFKRKFRPRIIQDITHYVCKCGQQLDCYGDHRLGCTANTKTKASNGIRDGIIRIFQHILPVAKIIDSSTQVEPEIHNIVKSLPRLKPFYLSMRLGEPTSLASAFMSPSFILPNLQFLPSQKSEAATYTESDLCL